MADNQEFPAMMIEPGWGPDQHGATPEDNVLVEKTCVPVRLKLETAKAVQKILTEAGYDLDGFVPDEAWLFAKEKGSSQEVELAMIVAQAALHRLNRNADCPKTRTVVQTSGGYREEISPPMFVIAADIYSDAVSSQLWQDSVRIKGQQMIIIAKDPNMPEGKYNQARRMFNEEVQNKLNLIGRKGLLAPLPAPGTGEKI